MVNSLDLAVNSFIQSIQNPFLVKLMSYLTSLGDVQILLPLSIIIIAVLVYSKRYKHGAIASLALILGISSSELLKYLIQRARPENALMKLTDYSFPSGHALMSTIFFFLLYFLYKENLKNKFRRKIFLSICIILPILISFSRLYLNIHWLTDVIAGMIIGIFWALLFTRIDKNKNK